MNSVIDFIKAVIIAFVAIAVIVGGVLFGTFIIPILGVALLIYVIYLALEEERYK